MADNLRILIVDDEVEIRRFLRASLSVHGYTVFEATNGERSIANGAKSSSRPGHS